MELVSFSTPSIGSDTSSQPGLPARASGRLLALAKRFTRRRTAVLRHGRMSRAGVSVSSARPVSSRVSRLVHPALARARERRPHRSRLTAKLPERSRRRTFEPSISADGRLVAFESDATTLVSGDTNGFRDVFVRDSKLHRTTRVSVSTAGFQGDDQSAHPSISADGRFVASPWQEALTTLGRHPGSRSSQRVTRSG